MTFYLRIWEGEALWRHNKSMNSDIGLSHAFGFAKPWSASNADYRKR